MFFRLLNDGEFDVNNPVKYNSNLFYYLFLQSNSILNSQLYSDSIYEPVVEIQADRLFYGRISIKNDSSTESLYESSSQIVNENDTAIFDITY